ncbi:MAG TPA: TOBE domain-containing protein, partial [Burkholderiales bacterium]|nr:TOBE domain-containing protein [Burkholderiales bacterium]
EAMTMADKIVVMNAGRVEQIGTPLDCYDNPANLFVAGFIGSPAMNFISGTVHGGAIDLGGGVSFPLKDDPSIKTGSRVILGVRPEHLSVSSEGLPAEVVVVEPTGADTQIYCKLAGTDVNAVVRERHEFHPGEMIRLAPQLSFLFDPASGARLA